MDASTLYCWASTDQLNAAKTGPLIAFYDAHPHIECWTTSEKTFTRHTHRDGTPGGFRLYDTSRLGKFERLDVRDMKHDEIDKAVGYLFPSVVRNKAVVIPMDDMREVDELAKKWDLLSRFSEFPKSKGVVTRYAKAYNIRKFEITYLFRLDDPSQVSAAGYELVPEGSGYSLIVPSNEQYEGTLVPYGSACDDFMAPLQESAIQQMSWTFVGLRLFAQGMPRESISRDNITAKMAFALWNDFIELSQRTQEQSLALAAKLEDLNYPALEDMDSAMFQPLYDCLSQISFVQPDDNFLILHLMTRLVQVFGEPDLEGSDEEVE